jgi:hypothetical protein
MSTILTTIIIFSKYRNSWSHTWREITSTRLNKINTLQLISYSDTVALQFYLGQGKFFMFDGASGEFLINIDAEHF